MTKATPSSLQKEAHLRIRPTITALILAIAIPVLAAPTTPPFWSDPPRLARAQRIHNLLDNLIDQADRPNGNWPTDYHSPEDPALLYTPPPKSDHTSRLIVFHESLTDHPDGVWIAYADGHLEWAPSAAALAACQNQPQLMEKYANCIAAPMGGDATTQPADAHADLHIQAVDAANHPLAAAAVGEFVDFDPNDKPTPQFFLASSGNPVNLHTDAAGQLTLRQTDLFHDPYLYNDRTIAPLFLLDSDQNLSALVPIHRDDFHQPSRTIVLQPAAQITAQFAMMSDPAFTPLADKCHIRPIALQEVRLRCAMAQSKDSHLSLITAPGDYEILISAQGCYSTIRMAHLAPGDQLHLNLLLEPTALQRLIGQKAPELRNIKAWKNSPPLTLAALHNKVVLLDFWGYWCNPCISQMPALMNLYDQFRNRDLVIIAIHDDSIDSIPAMDARLTKAIQQQWGGRNLPFPIALDGGGPTPMAGTTDTARGATTAAYGIESFPTTLLIARDGRILGKIDPASPDAAAQIENALKQ